MVSAAYLPDVIGVDESCVFYFIVSLFVSGLVLWVIGSIYIVMDALKRGRPRAKGYWSCQRCGYNMRTVPGPVCPECGKPHEIPEQSKR